jgi:hypothetical protein
MPDTVGEAARRRAPADQAPNEPDETPTPADQAPNEPDETPTPAARMAVGDRASFRIAVFGALLVVVLFGAYGLGRITGGGTAADTPPSMTMPGGVHATVMPGGAGAPMPGIPPPGEPGDESQPHAHDAAPPAGARMPTDVGGLSLSSGGLTLVPAATTFPAGRTQRLTFKITGTGGAPITTYAMVHDKPLHLVVIRRDLSGYQHLHPTMAADGTWSIDLSLGAPGSYRAIADFTAVVGGRPVATTLGTDLTVGGSYAPVALPAPARQVTTDNFTVSYGGTPRTGSTQPLLVTVAGPGGRPAVLEPYLGAFGHLVVIRQGDVGYVHVHPEPRLVDGKVKFWLTAPSPGTYRMFFDFQVAGTVHTAAWTATVAE